ncbi:hypothetical protein DYB32_000997 [Aphanomyces invadans]|uniref:U2A'/phosphoprotein 32 family A C-terminal domain-containing protein n=1 Tax=Aphanomyces invadans TaxID=157072 RepID=A0A3R6ZA36_9STRA|nr:hypothetical protein DYB32_000997 [Aphanomyces invadans]
MKPRMWKDVDVANNQIESLASLAHLPFLIALNAENNNLTTLLAIGSMLHIANLARNHIVAMRDLRTHRYIQDLILDHNQITDITGIADLVFLKYLSISHNKLTTTKGLTSNLPIEILNLSHNEIADTAQLPGLTRLLNVNVAHNRIRSLDEFGVGAFVDEAAIRVDGFSRRVTRIPYYRFRILVRTQQIVMLDGFPASIKERIKAKVIHGDDIRARTDIFDSHMKGDTFINYLVPLEHEYNGAPPDRHPTTLKPPQLSKASSCKNMAEVEAAKAILMYVGKSQA